MSLLATAGFPEEQKAAGIAERLHKLGVNVVRFGDLDIASGPGRSLIDDVRDDTVGLDPISWARMTNFQSELTRRGIYYSMEMHAHRRFREGDGIKDVRKLPFGGGPAAVFDPELTTRITDLSKAILTEPISDDGKTWRDWKPNRRDESNARKFIYQNDTPENCRFVQIKLKHAGIIPAGAPGEGKSAWLFLDEILLY